MLLFGCGPTWAALMARGLLLLGSVCGLLLGAILLLYLISLSIHKEDLSKQKKGILHIECAYCLLSLGVPGSVSSTLGIQFNVCGWRQKLTRKRKNSPSIPF